jgi:hypothetical protein
VTHEGLAKVTNRTDHSHASGEDGMLDEAITCFEHAFDFATLSTHRKTLDRLAEVAEGARFLLAFALVAFHR